MYGHDDKCPDTDEEPLEDGITEGGIDVGPVGYEDMEDDCSERTVYVSFEVEVIR